MAVPLYLMLELSTSGKILGHFCQSASCWYECLSWPINFGHPLRIFKLSITCHEVIQSDQEPQRYPSAGMPFLESLTLVKRHLLALLDS